VGESPWKFESSWPHQSDAPVDSKAIDGLGVGPASLAKARSDDDTALPGRGHANYFAARTPITSAATAPKCADGEFSPTNATPASTGSSFAASADSRAIRTV
jgi:hypothetical protein